MIKLLKTVGATLLAFFAFWGFWLLLFLAGCPVADGQTVVISNYSAVDHNALYGTTGNTMTIPVKAHSVVQIPVPDSHGQTIGIGTQAYGQSGGLPGIGPTEVWYLEIINDSGQYNGPIVGYTFVNAPAEPWMGHVLAVLLVILVIITLHLAKSYAK